MAAFVGLLFGHPNASFALPKYLVDTGPGPDNVDISQTPSALMAVDQWLGFRFDTGSSVRIGGVEGWMSVIPGGQGYGRLALYQDSNNVVRERHAPLSIEEFPWKRSLSTA